MNSWRKSKSILAILLLAAFVRIGFLIQYRNNLELDSSFLLHAEVARNILNGKWFQIDQSYLGSYVAACRSTHTLIDPKDYPSPTSERLTPLYNDEGGYGVLLALTWKIFGTKSWWYVRVLQVLLDVVACGLIYLVGRKMFGSRSALISAFLYAVFIPGVELAVRPHRDIWVTFAFVASVFLLLKIVETKRIKTSLWFVVPLAIIIALTAWMRSTIVAYVGICSFVLFLEKPWRHALALSVVLIGTFFLLMSPLIIRNYEVFHKPMITRGAFWHSFWAGVGQFKNPYGIVEEDKAIADYFRAKDSSAIYGTDRYEQVLRREALHLVVEHPAWYASTVIRRAAVILSPKIGRELFFQSASNKRDTGILNRDLSGWVLLLIDGAFFIGLVTGIWQMRSRWKSAVVVGLPLLYTLVTLSPFYVVGRNIMNVYFVTMLFAAAAAVRLLETMVRNIRSPRADLPSSSTIC